MDFGSLLKTARSNEQHGKNQAIQYYKHKLSPPKKEEKNKQLSENIKKFLAAKEQEQQQQQREILERKKRLLALRAQDKKATRRVKAMLKTTKSAIRSEVGDVTTPFAPQPDEDDYGYESQTAAAIYNQLMEKYSKIPDKPIFPKSSTRRVKVETSGIKGVSINCSRNGDNLQPSTSQAPPITGTNQKTIEETKSKERAPPPTINFTELLKIAEQKQHEPIVIVKQPRVEEKLMTRKEKKEQELIEALKKRKHIEYLEVNKICTDPSTTKPSFVGKAKEANESRVRKKQQIDEYKPLKVDSSELNQVRIVKNSKVTVFKTEQKTRGNIARTCHAVKSFNASKTVNKRKHEQNMLEKPIVRQEHKRAINHKRVIHDDDEYDSEMDDFIDDGSDIQEDYSKHIRDIFGYDKSKYRYADEDDTNMESSFCQQMREESISTKVGIMEDLDDMRREDEHKQRKMLLKKKHQHKL